MIPCSHTQHPQAGDRRDVTPAVEAKALTMSRQRIWLQTCATCVTHHCQSLFNDVSPIEYLFSRTDIFVNAVVLCRRVQFCGGEAVASSWSDVTQIRRCCRDCSCRKIRRCVCLNYRRQRHQSEHHSQESAATFSTNTSFVQHICRSAQTHHRCSSRTNWFQSVTAEETKKSTRHYVRTG